MVTCACAVARTVLGYKGTSLTQCALVLHRLHAAPSGAHLTGDQCELSSKLIAVDMMIWLSMYGGSSVRDDCQAWGMT